MIPPGRPLDYLTGCPGLLSRIAHRRATLDSASKRLLRASKRLPSKLNSLLRHPREQTHERKKPAMVALPLLCPPGYLNLRVSCSNYDGALAFIPRQVLRDQLLDKSNFLRIVRASVLKEDVMKPDWRLIVVGFLPRIPGVDGLRFPVHKTPVIGADFFLLQ
jgi:hypothetical protein